MAVSGWHQLTARVVMPPGQNDSDPKNNEATTQVYINSPPVALLWVSDQRPGQGDWVDLSGLQSTDDTRVTHYLFDFDDGEDSGWLAEAETSHAYLEKGAYQARLMVQDDAGAQSDWSAPVPVKVRDAPPMAALSVRPSKGTVLTNFSFTSRSGDPDGGIAEIVWGFGDGTTARGERAWHNYSRHGDFLVTLTVRDDAGGAASSTFLLTVQNLPPVPAISFDARRPRVGEKVSFWANNSTDPDDPPSAIGYVWDFGGGQKATGPSVSYAFAGPGWHRVTLTASDGNLSGECWVEVEVRSTAPARSAVGAGPLAWAVLGLILASMATLAAFIMYPFKPIINEEEE
jgi:PKD repeat protein